MVTMVGEGSPSSDFLAIFPHVPGSSLPKMMSFVSFCLYFSILCPTSPPVHLEKNSFVVVFLFWKLLILTASPFPPFSSFSSPRLLFYRVPFPSLYITAVFSLFHLFASSPSFSLPLSRYFLPFQTQYFDTVTSIEADNGKTVQPPL